MIRVREASFDPEAELAAFRARVSGAGAVASFVGCVRATPNMHGLYLEHYPAMTERAIMAFVDEATTRFALMSALVIHRVGAMAPGEPIVLVACASAHRKQALSGVDYLMDRLKTEAPFWKREEGVGGHRWIEPHDEDYAAAAHWHEGKDAKS